MFPKSAICKIQHVPSTEDPKAVQEINIGNQPDGVVKRVFEVSLFQDPQNHPKGLRGSKPYGVCKKIELQTRYLEAVAMGHYGPILTALSHQCVRSPTWWAAVAGVYCLRCVAWKCGKALQDFTTWHDLTWIFYDILISLLGPFCKDSSCGGKLCSGSLLETKMWVAIVILWCSIEGYGIAVWFYVLKPFSHVS